MKQKNKEEIRKENSYMPDFDESRIEKHSSASAVPVFCPIARLYIICIMQKFQCSAKQAQTMNTILKYTLNVHIAIEWYRFRHQIRQKVNVSIQLWIICAIRTVQGIMCYYYYIQYTYKRVYCIWHLAKIEWQRQRTSYTNIKTD